MNRPPPLMTIHEFEILEPKQTDPAGFFWPGLRA
jgi:hypothetical protein